VIRFAARNSGSFTILPIALPLMQLVSTGHCSAQNQSASDLVRHFAIQSASLASSASSAVFSCTQEIAKYVEDRGVADALVKLGPSAMPDIDAALDSIVARGPQSEFAFNAEWLLNAYARIEGSAAYGRLHRMSNNPRLGFLQGSLDRSTAISLGLTSYVTSSEELAERGDCRGVIDPNDMLNQLILAWERNDRVWVERSLGTRAKSALASLMQGRTWEQARTELWLGKAEYCTSVGYRFTSLGWSSPSHQPVTVNDRSPVNPDINTTFADHSGRECGQFRVTFLKEPDQDQRPAYFINNSDVAGLLRLIASCAEE
jgi:hypothetical protein